MTSHPSSSATILTRAQLEKIKKTAYSEAVFEPKQDEKQRLKDLSDSRAAKWSNTLTAQRARNDRLHVERLAAEELEKQEIDRQEAEHRAENRRLQIERANKILFDESDRVRGFHSRLLKSDTIQENEMLIGFKKQIDVMKKAQEAAFVDQQKRALELAEAAELRKFGEEKERAMHQKTVQMRQLEEVKTKIIAERKETKREGLLLKQRAIEEAEEQRLKEVERRNKALELTAAVAAANTTLQAFKLKEMEREREQERAMEAYANKKAASIAERERVVAERRAAKEAERKRVADAIEKNYNDWMAREKSRMDRDEAKAAQASAADDSSRRQRIMDTMADLDASNRAQLAAKADAKARRRQDEAVGAQEWSIRLAELKKEEEQEVRDRLAKERRLASFHLRQAEAKARKRAAQRIEELQEVAQIELTLREQEEIFRQYAEEWVGEYRRLGKSTVPMESYLNKKETVETMR